VTPRLGRQDQQRIAQPPRLGGVRPSRRR
jgi:hypothetical protein